MRYWSYAENITSWNHACYTGYIYCIQDMSLVLVYPHVIINYHVNKVTPFLLFMYIQTAKTSISLISRRLSYVLGGTLKILQLGTC